MKVIKNNLYQGYPRRCKCGSCESIIEIDIDDLIRKDEKLWSPTMGEYSSIWLDKVYYYFLCPLCGEEVYVDNEYRNKDTETELDIDIRIWVYDKLSEANKFHYSDGNSQYHQGYKKCLEDIEKLLEQEDERR